MAHLLSQQQRCRVQLRVCTMNALGYKSMYDCRKATTTSLRHTVSARRPQQDAIRRTTCAQASTSRATPDLFEEEVTWLRSQTECKISLSCQASLLMLSASTMPRIWQEGNTC